MNIHSFLARVYHTAGCNAKAADEVLLLSSEHDGLTADDEATMTVVSKTRIATLRKAYRIVSAVELREDSKGNTSRVLALRNFKAKLEEELSELISRFLSVIDGTFLVNPSSEPSKILFMKEKADLFRYLAEIQRIQPQEVRGAYMQAYDASRNSLGPAHPLRTGIALNFSVFYLDILKDRDHAISIARTAYDEGIAASKGLPADEHEDAKENLETIKKNLEMWMVN